MVQICAGGVSQGGALTEDARAFLRGRDTGVPGSWLNGQVSRGNAKCRDLRDGGGASQETKVGARRARSVTPRDIRRQERGARNQERERRRLPDGPRFHATKFRSAPGVFPNNDVKYEVNELRASQHARVHEGPAACVPARDALHPDALRERQ